MKKWILVLMAVVGMVFTGCGDSKSTTNTAVKVEQKEPVAVVKQSVVAPLEKAKNEIENAASEVKQNSKELAKEAKEEVKEEAQNIAQAAQEIKEDVATTVKETAEAVENKVEEAAQNIEEAVAPVNQRGIELYAKCAACHGLKGEKKALGNSMVIKGWSVEQTTSSLKGYKNKTYGGSMKTIMMSQVATLSDEDIHALAEHILGL